MSSIRTALPVLGLAALLTLFGCTSSAPPETGGSGDGLGDFEGEIDPGSESFVFKTLDVPSQDGIPIRVQLIGRLVLTRAHPFEVGLVVSVRNIDTRTLFAPGEIVLHDFTPPTTRPQNPDWVACPEDSIPPDAKVILLCKYGFDYSQLLGADAALTPGETSGEKLWSFVNPSGGSFSFGARARFGLERDPPIISGVFFHDPNRNGVQDPDEGPFGGGAVEVAGPGIETRIVPVGDNGRYSVHATEPGIYTLWGIPPPTFGLAPVEFTTPNPLEVVILPAQSFFHADFGLANAFRPYPPVRFADREDSLKTDRYDLLDIGMDGRILKLRVGFSGCGPEHPLHLFMVGGFMESIPLQARIILYHDDLGELCDAYWERDLGFDMTPVLRESGEDVVILRFVDWTGAVHSFRLN